MTPNYQIPYYETHTDHTDSINGIQGCIDSIKTKLLDKYSEEDLQRSGMVEISTHRHRQGLFLVVVTVVPCPEMQIKKENAS